MVDEDDTRPTDAMAVPPEHEPSGDLLDVRVGTVIGEYIVDGELGHGGMGVVYSAIHPVIGKRVAIKILKSSSNPAAVERFVREARAVNEIGHPNIVDIFDFAQLSDGRRYLVMDRLVGESLRARVRRGPLPVGEACAVLLEVASALAAAHAKGFAHRDLKPDNVFLCEQAGRIDVKLLDFGLAKLLPSSHMVKERAFRTATGAQIGTPDYMSPEQVRADPDVDHRTDIYALGIVAFEIITGTRPRRLTGDLFDLVGTPGQAVAAIAGVPPELAQLVDTMLAADPAQRPSIAATRTVLKRISSMLSSASNAVEPAIDVAAPPPAAYVAPAATASASAPRSPLYRTTLGVQPARAGEPARVVSSNQAAVVPERSRRGWWLVTIVVTLVGVGVALVIALG